MIETLHSLIDQLGRADSFESVAEIALGAALGRAAQALESSPLQGKGRFLRGMVHLRPEGGYRQLVVLGHGHAQATPVPGDDSMRPSLTVWRQVEIQGSWMAVDVQLGTATPPFGQPVVLTDGSAPREAPHTAFASQNRLLDRDATHLLALPLRPRPGRVAGMISLEASCPAAMGLPFIWAECASDLQLLVDLVTPHLLARPPRQSSASLHTGDDLLPVVGRTMEGPINLLRFFARQGDTILLCGPTGAGKSRLARWCHTQSVRHGRPFETVNLQTLPTQVQMAELFGWRKGAFTGSVGHHQGFVGKAEGGTLFLDEIDKLSMEAQAGLLELLEERRYHALGDPSAHRADVRFIVGTNVDLRAAVKDGSFREDLYYRIAVLPIEVPPLRERADEIVPWSRYMLERRHREGGVGTAVLASEAEAVLTRFPWPGNLRQLDNVIRRAYAMALSERTGEALDVEILRRHLERALAFEQDEEAGLLVALRRAARAYALEADRRAEHGRPLSLDLAEALPGLVLSEGVALTGSRKDAFRLFGLGHMVDSRNHHKAFERAVAKTLAALEQAGEESDAELRAHLATLPIR